MRSIFVMFFSGVLVFGLVACDRLPAVGGEGQPCFGNGTCAYDLVCNTSTMICCGPDGCDTGCGSCPAGTYCVVETCMPCQVIEHCGNPCMDCSSATIGLLCLEDEASEWSCGCNQDADCLPPRTCVDGFCENLCTPQCAGKCAGEDDTCDGQCPDPCESGNWCAAGVCTACGLDADHCGQACLVCSGNVTNRACIDDGEGDFECGCITGADCDTGQCAGGACDDCVPDCENKCDDAADTCGGICSSPCGTGFCCLAQGCVDANVAAHCGPDCTECVLAPEGDLCLELQVDSWSCGCNSDADCPGQQRTCDNGTHVCSCVPDCAGKCAPADDGCGGTCAAGCGEDCCVAGACEPHTQAEHCGLGCVSCVGQSDGSACVQVGGSEYHCGCGSDADCTNPMTCQLADQLCGTDLPPEPLYSLDLTGKDCNVVDLALSAAHPPHQKVALLLGCGGSSNLERLWFLEDAIDGVLNPDGPHALWSMSNGDNDVRSVDFRTDNYGILSAFMDNMAMNGSWLHREQNAAAWSAAVEMTGVSFAHYSPAGDRVVVQSGFDMGSDWALYDMSFTQVGSTLTTSGYGSIVGFTADGVYALSGANSPEPGEGGVSAVLAADGTARQDAGAGNSIETMAFPTDYNASQEFATVSQPAGGGNRSLRVWTGLTESDLRAPLEISLAEQVGAIAFLPVHNGDPSAVILGVELGSIVGFQITGDWAGIKLSPELTIQCNNLYQTRMRPSRDGTLLAFSCGSQVLVWEVAALRGYFVPTPDS